MINFLKFTDQFQCDKDKCIPNGWKCDRTNDCVDQTDENNSTCLNHTCPAKHFQCKDGKYVI